MRPPRTRVLFVCSRNRWRSPTAAAIYARDERVQVRSAGLSPKSPHRLSAADVAWADVVLFMEKRHRTRALEAFGDALRDRALHVLDVEDAYERMDPELVELLRGRVEPILAGLGL